jgi:hypothetical protein
MSDTDWRQAALELDRWMAERDYAGHDPHDLLASPVVRRLTFGSRWAAVAWTQLGKRLPVQTRRALRVPAMQNAKGVGLVVAGKVRLRPGSGSGSESESGDVSDLLKWLEEAAIRGGKGVGWGYPFPWANRDFQAPAGTPSGVVTAFVGHALLDAAERLGGEVADRARSLAREAPAFLTTSLQRIPGPDDTFCFSYTPLDRRAVHNANVLVASLLARADSSRATAALVARATRFTLQAQRDDGAWLYGTAHRDHWIDSFHTGYILLSLEEIGRHVEVDGLEEAAERGIAYWRDAFFQGPAVGNGPGDRFPVDAHAVAQAILTFLGLSHRIPDARAEAERLGRWLVDEMREPDGHYAYMHYGRWKNRLAYMRWTQAWVFRALAELATETRSTA